VHRRDIVSYLLSQAVMVKNTGEGSSMINSTTDPVRSLILPSCEEIKTSVSLAIFRNLIVFDGVNNFSGYSGIDLVRTAARSTETFSYSAISDSIAWKDEDSVSFKRSSEGHAGDHDLGNSSSGSIPCQRSGSVSLMNMMRGFCGMHDCV